MHSIFIQRYIKKKFEFIFLAIAHYRRRALLTIDIFFRLFLHCTKYTEMETIGKSGLYKIER